MSGDNSYANNPPRISKDNLFMIIALWMKDFVTREGAKIDENINQVGAVLVSADDKIYAADCSREGIHAVARLLIKHPERAKGSKIFISRGKSSGNDYKIDEVGEIFKSSSVAASLFIFDIRKNVLEDVRHCKSNKPFNESKFNKWESEWLTEEKEKIKREQAWPAYDKKMDKRVKERFVDAAKWIARVMHATGRSSKDSFQIHPYVKSQSSDFDPTDPKNRQKANHLLTLASFLAQRSDDPKTGDGAVIVNSKLEILGFGLNGYPLKLRYGEYGRGSSRNIGVEQKLPYVLHAEENALLMRNCHNLKDTIVFVTKQPCDDFISNGRN
ncbi:cytidine and dCMP deaminase domain-containing protein 1-like [Xenia sp. Carnegie-2017]|uniref:cytidine and dCMP deaminase domain-containing protein 1-like n=1 Tax=Xenia sp. Carnegie-2017 TaxID=2897299 RepID=UPI001F03EAA0|nr:cytidine and dCMP deaminase domain-containing protein 1-like [Xenia sp. Carnegie-2017]